MSTDLNEDPKAKADFATGLAKMADFKLWACHTKVDPWVERQILVFALETDTLIALERAPQEKLEAFDKAVREDARRIYNQAKAIDET